MATQYVTEAQVESNLKGGDFSATSEITSDDLSDIIDEESQVIDQHLKGRYDLPVTDADALIFLRKICIDLVVYRVSKILMPRDQKQLPDGRVVQDISHASAYREAMKMLKALRTGETTLPNTTDKSISMISSYQDRNNLENTFKKDTDQW